MVLGIGTDIVEVARIEKLYQKFPDSFAQRLLCGGELQELSAAAFPARFLAKRWALKESVSKALGTGIAKGVRFVDMEICHHDSGAPFLKLSGEAQIVAERLGIQNWQISVSDEQHYCVAYVLAQSNS